MYYYTIFFIINFLIFIIDWQVFKLENQLLKKISLILFILLPGLRYHVGWDYDAYDAFFLRLDKISLSDFIDIFSGDFEYEPLFVLLSFISVKLFIPPYLLISTIITTIYYKIVTSYFNRYFYIIFLGYIYYGYFQQFSIIRQGLSISVLYYSFTMIKDKKKQLIFCLLSILIHYSSLLSVIIFAISSKLNFKKKWIYLILICSIPLVLFKTNLVMSLVNMVTFQRYSVLTEIDFLNYKVGLSLKYIEAVILIILSIRLLPLESDKIVLFFFNLMIFEIINYAVFNDITIIYERYNVVFEFAHIVIFTLLMMRLFKNQLLSYFFILSFILFRYYQLFNSESRNLNELSHYERFFPYKTIFKKTSDE